MKWQPNVPEFRCGECGHQWNEEDDNEDGFCPKCGRDDTIHQWEDDE